MNTAASQLVLRRRRGAPPKSLPLDRIRAFVSPDAALRRAAALFAAGRPGPAFRLYARAAKVGLAEAEYRLGRCYLEGTGVPCSHREAARWLERAGGHGHGEAQSLLAILHLHGMAGERPFERGISPAASLFSSNRRTAPDYCAAICWARMAAAGGSGVGQAVLASILDSGPAEMRDRDEADLWYARSAAAGCPQGMLGHALALARKDGDAATQREMAAYLGRAAEAGLPAALHAFGVINEIGLGVARDKAAAARFYRRAAEKGNRLGQVRWGLALMYGLGIDADPVEGESWLRQAALAGDPNAAALLGDLYASRGAAPPDWVEAARWYRLAAGAGHGSAARALARLSPAEAGESDAEKAAQSLRTVAGSPAAAAAEHGNFALAGNWARAEGRMKPDQEALCACGSGLRSCRCCDLDPAYLASPQASEHLGRLVGRAADALASGNAEAAETLCINVLDVAPRLPSALWILYQIRRRAGRQNAAATVLQRLVALAPNHLDATQELAALLFERGDLAAAEQHARNAVRLAPAHPRSHNLMGMILTEAHRPQAGKFHYRRVLEITGARDPILLANLAWNLKCQGRIAEARQLYEESVEAAPDVFQTLFGWAQLEEADGNFAAARSLLVRAAAIRQDDPGLRVARATLSAREGDYAAALAELQTTASGENGTAANAGAAPDTLLEKGRILDRMGRYDEAFACFAEAKRQARAVTGKSYLEHQAGEIAQRLRQFFVSDRVRLMPLTPVRDDCVQPIFILGFPRSGTTLAEQALSRHPRISAGDELPFINELSDAIPRLFGSPLPYPEALAELWMGDNRQGLETLRDAYLRKVLGSGIVKPGSAWFTDKMPLNEMHLGLISLMFPRSPLIHILRHPLDVVLSVFSHHLTHGYFCAYELETIARHYVLVADLVQHYRTELALRYLPVRYEDMVADMEASLRRMLAFMNEPFDERCVRFEDNRRLPHTPSYAQVRENLYTRSRFRYRHYLRHLDPVIPVLQPVLDRLGYSLS